MTKKFVNGLSQDGSAASRSRFHVPARDGSAQFEELETGKRHELGYLVYTGTEISVDDIAKKWMFGVPVSEDTRLRWESYLSEIIRFKVGNVVALESVANNCVRLQLVSHTPRPKVGPKLP